MSVVLITGCSSGFGLQTALAFGRRGDTVVASMRDPAKATALLDQAEHEGLRLEVPVLDVTDDASVVMAVGDIEARHGGVDVLVNNAGVAYGGPIETIDVDRARTVIETNLWGAVRTIRAVLPCMRAKGAGVVVNVSSAAGRVPSGPYAGFYSMSKHALGALSEALAWEVAPFGIRVACIEPGFFSTEIYAKGDAGVDLTSPYGADSAWISDFTLKSVEVTGGDAATVAGAIVAAVDDPRTPLHVLVGDDAVAFVDLVNQAGSFEGWVPVAEQIVEASLGRPRPARLPRPT